MMLRHKTITPLAGTPRLAGQNRIRLLGLGFALAFTAIGGQLVRINVLKPAEDVNTELAKHQDRIPRPDIVDRYGNVLASRGSVIPLFHDQIRNGGPLTLTVPKMTRFLLTINQAVDTVFAALRSAKPGETYVPDAPSATILNLAKALLDGRKIKIEITGIRPGEKMHEIMVSEEEVHHCIKRGDYYVIRPMLPELRGGGKPGPNVLTKEFSSADNVLSLKDTASLLKKHRLMIEDVDLSQQGELLR